MRMLLIRFIATKMFKGLHVCCNLHTDIEVGMPAILFASNTLPTDFGLVAAAFAGAGSLLLIALRFVPSDKN